MTSNLHRRALCGALALVVPAAVACTPAPRPQAEVSVGAGGVTSNGNSPTDDRPAAANAGIDQGGANAPLGGGGGPSTQAATSGGPISGAPGVNRAKTGVGSTATSGAAGTATTRPPASAAPRTTLFPADKDRVGITDAEIVLCAHAALTYGTAFGTTKDDLNVYWTAINNAGGVFGRKVRVEYQNDNYDPATAVAAATNCRDSFHPFMILGGIGFDQIPAVRTWAEQNKELYFHHTATVEGSDALRYSYTGLPSVERMGAVFADVAAARFAGQGVGIIKRGSSNWEPGVKSFKAESKPKGVKIVLEREVQVNKGNYTQDILDLKSADAKVVWVWLNALESTQFIKQAKAQGYSPNFLVFPFNLTSQTLGNDALTPPLTGVAMYNAYSKGDRSGSFASYKDDLDQFEAQYQAIDPGVDLGGVGGDLLFLNWSAQKSFHQLLIKCGKDCSRDRFLDVISGLKASTNTSACPLDFIRPGAGNSHRGGWSASVMQTYTSPSGKVNFHNVDTCIEGL